VSGIKADLLVLASRRDALNLARRFNAGASQRR